MIKVAIVGLGIISRNHLEAIERNEHVTLVSVAEINISVAKEIGTTYGINYYLDYKEMAEKEEFDAVILNLPHYLHCEVSVYFLERGIHVLCEKPMATSVEECDKMIEASEKSGAKLAVGHIQRFFKSNEIIKNYIKNEELGRLCMTTEVRTADFFSDERPRWFLQKELSGGGMIMNFCAHSIDKLFSNIDCDEAEVLSSSFGNIVNDYNVEAHAQINIKIGGKIPASVTLCGYNVPCYSEMTYYFTNGILKDTSRNPLMISKNGENFVPLITNDEIDPFDKQLNEFLKLINGEKSIITDGYYSKKIIRIISEIYARDGFIVKE